MQDDNREFVDSYLRQMRQSLSSRRKKNIIVKKQIQMPKVNFSKNTLK